MEQMAKRVTVLGEPAVWDGNCQICGRATVAGNTNTVTFQWLNMQGVPFTAASYYACSPEHQRQLQGQLERFEEWKKQQA